ncbi:discoidin domain-containing protein [Luteipulveratus sp. YIM 133132]|uniref:discoidin domain-containing protein n=1 Tax=Luteipulveratus flavus TaxID=3031728 RepID=UPI0023B1708A|nr:discoidin domain-containing protein [Luteipulveratus sp. YIM 133132]MDE9365587.1 discoidin domain-containing protein [Luteipulveratus sp. YIM 133132]
MRGVLTGAALTAALLATAGALGTSGASAAESPTLPSPESEVNVTGTPFTGTNPDGTVRGLIDAHTHMFMQDGMGGAAVCGKVFSEDGIADALKDCASHGPDGSTALLENLTNSGNPFAKHDVVGWPTFKDWPSYKSLTHQQMYYRWVERAWRGGQRVMVNDLVSNGVLCSINPGTYQSCNEMDAIRLQAKDSYALQTFVDNQYGGAGKGWFRIVKTSAEARNVIQQGKLAVVLGVETSEPFGCKQVLNVPQCSKADIDKGLDEMYALGVRSMFPCHKFDNALCGVRFDEGTQGTIINAGQFLSTGTWWDAKACDPSKPHDHNPGGAPLPAGTGLPTGEPTYPSGAVCNTRGLTDLGAYMVKGMMKRGMMVEVDHMSAKAAGQTLSLLEEQKYPGVLASHSWMDEGYLDRLYALGGFSTIYGHATKEFIAEYQRTAPVRNKYGTGIGFGFDMNGFGGTPPPRDDAASNPVKYPFRSVDGGSLLDRQRTGQRTWDVNIDGVAHYGLVPDYVEDLRLVGGQKIVDDLMRGPESYLRTWGSTEAHQAPTNLATGRPVKASSYQNDLFTKLPPANAVDGNEATRWASTWNDGQWISVDLGSARALDRVVLRWETAYARDYDLQVSDDGTTWRTVKRVTGSAGGLEVQQLPAGTTGRYVRVLAQTRATSYGVSLWEVGVYGR